MDEVHYLADRSRGAVWEEVIIHLPESVAVVSLSATVSNAEEFGDWLSEVRGANDIIVDYRVGAGIRVAPHFYTRDDELATCVDAIDDCLASGAWKAHVAAARSAVVT